MTDEQNIKALECCVRSTSRNDCEKLHCPACKEFGCYYMDISDRDDSYEALVEGLGKTALVLINRQKAEIERLQKLQNPTGAGGFKVENGKVVYYSDVLNGYRHEYKDLDEIVKELNLYMHTDYKNLELISHYQHKAQTAKSEAIKEFAERLKEKRAGWGYPMFVLEIDAIDNLVKEMGGE